MTAVAVGTRYAQGDGDDERRELRVSVVPSPVRSQLLANLRAAILTGALEPGQHLVERELMALTDVGRGTIREALRQLAAEGLVTTVPNQGSVVARLSLEQVERIYEVRIELEGLLGRLFIERADSAQRDALVAALRSVERAAANGLPFVDQNSTFHDVLYAGADNEPLRELASSLRARVQYFRSRALDKADDAKRSIAGLRAIVRAVVSDDADAAAKAAADYTKVESAAVLMAVAMWNGPKTSASSAEPADDTTAEVTSRPADRATRPRPAAAASRARSATRGTQRTKDVHEAVPASHRRRPGVRADRAVSVAD